MVVGGAVRPKVNHNFLSREFNCASFNSNQIRTNAYPIPPILKLISPFFRRMLKFTKPRRAVSYREAEQNLIGIGAVQRNATSVWIYLFFLEYNRNPLGSSKE
jgi:hypothetical protein